MELNFFFPYLPSLWSADPLVPAGYGSPPLFIIVGLGDLFLCGYKENQGKGSVWMRLGRMDTWTDVSLSMFLSDDFFVMRTEDRRG